jgi:hypothetical protein
MTVIYGIDDLVIANGVICDPRWSGPAMPDGSEVLPTPPGDWQHRDLIESTLVRPVPDTLDGPVRKTWLDAWFHAPASQVPHVCGVRLTDEVPEEVVRMLALWYPEFQEAGYRVLPHHESFWNDHMPWLDAYAHWLFAAAGFCVVGEPSIRAGDFQIMMVWEWS